MMEERYVELINKEIDGLNTPSESQELKSYLSKNEEARKFYDDLLRTAKALKRVEEMQPPSYLKNHILNSIKFGPAPLASRPAWMTKVVEIFQRRPLPRYALVFAAGLCVGILLIIFANPFGNDNVPDVSKLSGSMILLTDLSHLQTIDSVWVNNEGINGTFKTYRSEGKVLVEFAVKSPEDLKVELNSDPEQLTFGGVSRLEGAESDVIVTGGKIVFTGVKSDHSIITFSETGSVQQALNCRIFKGNSMVQSISLRTN